LIFAIELTLKKTDFYGTAFSDIGFHQTLISSRGVLLFCTRLQFRLLRLLLLDYPPPVTAGTVLGCDTLWVFSTVVLSKGSDLFQIKTIMLLHCPCMAALHFWPSKVKYQGQGCENAVISFQP